MTDLYRVQTTDGKSVDVDFYDDWYSCIGGDEIWDEFGYAHNGGMNINLDTLEPLHLLTDDELQARDAELLERAAAHCEKAAWPPGLSKHPYDCGIEASAKHDAFKSAAGAIRAMKGQTHER